MAQTTLTIAAASDLSAVEPVLTQAFEKANPLIRHSFRKRGQRFAGQQIQAGAPFDLFLSANINLVDQLHLDDAKIYTVGHVAVLWKDGKQHPLSDLAQSSVRFVALPNPKLAPYGLAARQALEQAKLWSAVQPKAVYAENVRQTLQLFDSGNADAVLTAASLVVGRHSQTVPSAVVQKAGIVPSSKNAAAAKTFLDWLISAPAQQILARFGFSVRNSPCLNAPCLVRVRPDRGQLR